MDNMCFRNSLLRGKRVKKKKQKTFRSLYFHLTSMNIQILSINMSHLGFIGLDNTKSSLVLELTLHHSG